jgi:hypothetical protein
MNQPQISRLSAVVNTLGLAKTFSNPSLKVTVFVPTNQVCAPYSSPRAAPARVRARRATTGDGVGRLRLPRYGLHIISLWPCGGRPFPCAASQLRTPPPLAPHPLTLHRPSPCLP